jgi:hypothetical protein
MIPLLFFITYMFLLACLLVVCGEQAAPLYLSEMAPFKWRGSLNYLFGLGVTVGAFLANLINYGTAKMARNGWRVSLGLGGVPAILITIAGIALSDTPNSLIQRGKHEEGKAVLRRIRGVENVDVEFEDILIAGNHESREGIAAFKDVFKGKSLPPLIVSCLFQIFNQFTGSNDLSFYAPVLFSTLGFKSDGALYSAVILAGTTILATLFGLFLVDRLGRRALLMLGNLQMFISLVSTFNNFPFAKYLLSFFQTIIVYRLFLIHNKYSIYHFLKTNFMVMTLLKVMFNINIGLLYRYIQNCIFYHLCCCSSLSFKFI